MNEYYLTLILRSDLKEEDRKKILEGVTKKFGSLEKEDLWGSRDLAYPVKKQTKGWYAHFEFSLNPQDVSSLDKTLKLDEDIIRYLLIRK
ncbi:MAG: 30S ribosomal protein S6 [Candidatus Daviesbacteria bacterium]|nr:30S ribosomal protein S6 [Candidatus Daviesbacteria bacterium]